MLIVFCNFVLLLHFNVKIDTTTFFYSIMFSNGDFCAVIPGQAEHKVDTHFGVKSK